MQPIIVSRDVWYQRTFAAYLRVLHFLWDVRPDDQNVCRVVWGTIFLPLGLVYKVFRPLRLIECFGLFGFTLAILLYLEGSIWFGIIVTIWAGTYIFEGQAVRRRDRRKIESPATGASDKQHYEVSLRLALLEDWGERLRDSLAGLGDRVSEAWGGFVKRRPVLAHSAIFLVAAPFELIGIVGWFGYVVLGGVIDLLILLTTPIVIPVATQISDVIGFRRRQRSRHPNPIAEMARSFHARTCRRFQITD